APASTAARRAAPETIPATSSAATRSSPARADGPLARARDDHRLAFGAPRPPVVTAVEGQVGEPGARQQVLDLVAVEPAQADGLVAGRLRGLEPERHLQNLRGLIGAGAGEAARLDAVDGEGGVEALGLRGCRQPGQLGI